MFSVRSMWRRTLRSASPTTRCSTCRRSSGTLTRRSQAGASTTRSTRLTWSLLQHQMQLDIQVGQFLLCQQFDDCFCKTTKYNVILELLRFKDILVKTTTHLWEEWWTWPSAFATRRCLSRWVLGGNFDGSKKFKHIYFMDEFFSGCLHKHSLLLWSVAKFSFWSGTFDICIQQPFASYHLFCLKIGGSPLWNFE